MFYVIGKDSIFQILVNCNNKQPLAALPVTKYTEITIVEQYLKGHLLHLTVIQPNLLKGGVFYVKYLRNK